MRREFSACGENICRRRAHARSKFNSAPITGLHGLRAAIIALTRANSPHATALGCGDAAKGDARVSSGTGLARRYRGHPLFRQHNAEVGGSFALHRIRTLPRVLRTDSRAGQVFRISGIKPAARRQLRISRNSSGAVAAALPGSIANADAAGAAMPCFHASIPRQAVSQGIQNVDRGVLALAIDRDGPPGILFPVKL